MIDSKLGVIGKLSVVLYSSDGLGSFGNLQRVNIDGSFSIANVPAGSFQL